VVFEVDIQFVRAVFSYEHDRMHRAGELPVNKLYPLMQDVQVDAVGQVRHFGI